MPVFLLQNKTIILKIVNIEFCPLNFTAYILEITYLRL